MIRSLFSALVLALGGCATTPQAYLPPPPSVREPAAVDYLDIFDIENLRIYTSQGYLINQEFRDLVPLSFVQKYLDMSVAKTCARLIQDKVSYLDRVMVYPLGKLAPKDMKLYLLVNDALSRLPKYSGTFYRGTRGCGFGRDESGQLSSAFIDGGFMSTSKSKAAAEVFTRAKNAQDGDGAPKGCMATLESESGRRIYDLTGNYNDEREILFPMNVAFRMLGTPEVNGERTNVVYRELDPVAEKDVIEALKTVSYKAPMKLAFPNLMEAEAQPSKLKAAAERQQLSDLSENACENAEKFFSTDPKVRSRIDKESPIFDLKNKKLNPEDYPSPE